MSVDNESKFSDWTLNVRRNDNTIWAGLKYLGKVALSANETQIKMINWLAQKIKAVRKGGLLDGEEFENAAAMLDSKSVTASGCAKDLLAAAHKKQPEEAKTTLLHVLENGNKAARMAAAEALANTGEVRFAPRICMLMQEMNEMERRHIMRIIEKLISESDERPDTEEILKALKAAASKLRANTENIQEEFRKYYSQVRVAAKMVKVDSKKMKRRKRLEPYQKKLRAAASY